MEQHPVPQNITTFQFRLVGDMTIKQFGYVAAGVLLAYISTKLPLPFFFTWPATLFFSLGGFGLAFVPVEERPMDTWIVSFLRTIYSPTQYVWQKRSQSPNIAFTPAPQSLTGVPPTGQKSSGLRLFFQTFFHRVWKAPRAPVPCVNTLTKPVAHTPQPQPVVQKTYPPTPAHEPIPQATNAAVLQKIQTQKTMQDPEVLRKQSEQLANQLASLKNQPLPPGATTSRGLTPTISMAAPNATVRAIGMESAVSAGIPRLTTFPNIVTGIIKDERGNLLPGALVTVRDLHDVPLRALKTNRLGQFAASTPLPVGTYRVEVEDPQQRYAFDRAQISIDNTVLPAFEIHAKTQRQLSRDKLAREIFETNQM